MPYMVGYTEDVEKSLFLHEKFSVPYWGLTYAFGHDDSYWERIVISLVCFAFSIHLSKFVPAASVSKTFSLLLAIKYGTFIIRPTKNPSAPEFRPCRHGANKIP